MRPAQTRSAGGEPLDGALQVARVRLGVDTGRFDLLVPELRGHVDQAGPFVQEPAAKVCRSVCGVTSSSPARLACLATRSATPCGPSGRAPAPRNSRSS